MPITLTGSAASTGIRVYAPVGLTFVLRSLANTKFLALDRELVIGSYAELSGFTVGQSCKLEVRDSNNALLEMLSLTANQNAVHTYTLPTFHYPLSGQTYLDSEQILFKVSAPSNATVTNNVGAVLAFNSSTSCWEGSISAASLTVGSNYSAAVTVTVNGASHTKTVYKYPIADSRYKLACQINSWLYRATDVKSTGKLVRERYMVNTQSWGKPGYGGGGAGDIWYRADCNAETMLTYYHMWQSTGNSFWYDLARQVWSQIKVLKQANGSFAFWINGNGSVGNAYWFDDNPETSQHLLRCAEIDTTNSAEYRSDAVGIMNWALSYQRSSDGQYAETAGGSFYWIYATTKVMMGLAWAYPYTSQQSAYQTAIEKGLAYVMSQILPSGRVKTWFEINNQTPDYTTNMTDQCGCIKAFAAAEKFLPGNVNVPLWRAARRSMVSWMLTNKLLPNGGLLGHDYPNLDKAYCEDRVYYLRVAVDGLMLSYQIDGDSQYYEAAQRILNFQAETVHLSDIPEMNGALRGSYNLKDNNYDVSQYLWWADAGEEHGGHVIYSGWTNAPTANAVFEFAALSVSVPDPMGAGQAMCAGVSVATSTVTINGTGATVSTSGVGSLIGTTVGTSTGSVNGVGSTVTVAGSAMVYGVSVATSTGSPIGIGAAVSTDGTAATGGISIAAGVNLIVGTGATSAPTNRPRAPNGIERILRNIYGIEVSLNTLI